MPKFSDREEYERWKKEKLKSNLDKIGGRPADQEIPEAEQEKKSDAGPSSIQPVAETGEMKSISDRTRKYPRQSKRKNRTQDLRVFSL